MKIQKSSVSLIKIHIGKGENRYFRLVEQKLDEIFIVDDDIDYLDQVMITGSDEFYICFEITEKIKGGYDLKFITLNDYYIYKFHSILDNEILSWLEKSEMVRDLSDEILHIFKQPRQIRIGRITKIK